MLDLAVTQTKNNLKSWFIVYLDKYCHKSIQKLKTVAENKRNLHFLFEFWPESSTNTKHFIFSMTKR